jgi:tRNA A37 threonylcarbamoyladenosine biosynthesis protein TsaE
MPGDERLILSCAQERPPAPFPLTVVTGFLGAGKTSLLNALLRDLALARQSPTKGGLLG